MKSLKEIVAERNPECICDACIGGVTSCPKDYYYLAKYLPNIEKCPKYDATGDYGCKQCWGRECNNMNKCAYGKRVDNGEWVYGYYMQRPNLNTDYIVTVGNSVWYAVEKLREVGDE